MCKNSDSKITVVIYVTTAFIYIDRYILCTPNTDLRRTYLLNDFVHIYILLKYVFDYNISVMIFIAILGTFGHHLGKLKILVKYNEKKEIQL